MQQFKMCSCSVPHGYLEEKVCRECGGVSPYYIRQIEAHNLELIKQSRKDSDQINALTESGLRQQSRIKELEEENKRLIDFLDRNQIHEYGCRLHFMSNNKLVAIGKEAPCTCELGELLTDKGE